MKKKYKVSWVNVRQYNCEHTVEAKDEHEAKALVVAMDSADLEQCDESDNEDYQFEFKEV